jgi:hypothetical protein
MIRDTALIEKREELKRRLTAGEYKTLVDVFLKWFDKQFQKITRQPKPLSIWAITIILTAAINLIGFIAVNVIDDTVFVLEFLRSNEILGLLTVILASFLAIASAIVINQYVNRIFIFWSDNVFDLIESVDSLMRFEDWLQRVSNRKLHLFVTIAGGIIAGGGMSFLISERVGVFIGYATTFTNIAVSMFSAAFVHLLFMVVFLSASLQHYDIKLFGTDPSSSKIVYRLSNELSFVSFLVAIYAAVLTLIAAWGDFLPSFGVFVILFLWLPIIALFTLNQTSLSRIIRRVKWKTLNEVQTKVEKLQTAKNFGNLETMDAIRRLTDYHDRVKATRDSALDFRTYLSFFNSLLLPLLAFILGNLDLVLKLFASTP